MRHGDGLGIRSQAAVFYNGVQDALTHNIGAVFAHQYKVYIKSNSYDFN